MQNDDEGLRSIILASQGILVKMLITLEPHGIFQSYFAYIHFNVSETQVCKTVIRLCKDFFGQTQATVLHICVSIMLKCIRTRFLTERISEQLC